MKRVFIGKEDFKLIWTGIMAAVLVATSPSWLSSKAQTRPGYDAPWIYPANNPVARINQQ